MKKYEILEFPYFSDSRGETVPFELGDLFPFEVRRAYIVTGAPGGSRGGHAHTQEEEVFVAVSGSVTALILQGDEEHEISLDTKNKGIYIPIQCWHEFQDFSADCVLLAFSSTHYSGRSGYIEDKSEFLRQFTSQFPPLLDSDQTPADH